MANALITGLNGFTGRYVAAELRAANCAVAGLVFGGGGNICEGEYRCDLRDRTFLSEVLKQVKPDVVVHLAAISFVAHSDVDEIYRTNIVGARNLLQCLSDARHTLRSVILASSANVYGNSDLDKRICSCWVWNRCQHGCPLRG